MHERVDSADDEQGWPWFWRHPGWTVSVAVALYVGILVLRCSVAGVDDPISMFYVLPITLVALSFGFRAGLAAGVAAVGLVVVWIVGSGEHLSVLGWGTRAVPLLLVGALAGSAAERIRDAYRKERRLVEVALLQREAAEINDSVVQGMAAAKWMLEAGQVEPGLELLGDTMETAQQLVGRLLGSGSPLTGDLRRSRPVAARQRP